MLTDEEIKAKVRAAFSPLRCVAEIWDHKAKLRFRVFDSKDNGIINMPSIVLREVRDEKQLKQVLQGARSRVEAKGFVLGSNGLVKTFEKSFEPLTASATAACPALFQWVLSSATLSSSPSRR